MNLDTTKIVIIGAGKVGQSLDQLGTLAGLDINVCERSFEQQCISAAHSDIVFLCVNDDAIESLCEQLAGQFKTGSIVVHCSGALNSDVLNSARKSGGRVASFHPLNTFPTVEAALALSSSLDHATTAYIEGDEDAVLVLKALAKQLGFLPKQLHSSQKANYHAACVFACNYLTTLMQLSRRTALSAGLDEDDFWQSVQPLILSTLRNITEHGPVNALSGPIARGDLVTVQKHLTALTDTKQPYQQLGLATLELAEQRAELSARQLTDLRELLS